MRKTLLSLLTFAFLLIGGVATQSALARPLDAAPLQVTVTGLFSPEPGVNGKPFQGAVTVNRFGAEDGQLVIQGALAATDDSLFSPFAVTVPAYATASESADSGCAVVITTVETFISVGFLVAVHGGARVTLSEADDPEAARELCRVVSTATRDPADQQALARTLNRVLAVR
jgi:hypothetical protein